MKYLNKTFSFLKVVFLMLLIWSANITAQIPNRYKVIDLGTLDEETFATSINDSGQVTGYSDVNNVDHAFIWEDGVIQDLGITTNYLNGGGYVSRGNAISNSRQIVGTMSTGDDYAFLWKDGITTLLPPDTTWSRAYSINNNNQIVGLAATGPNGIPEVVYWQDGVLNSLNVLGWAQGNNDLGQIVYYNDSNGGTYLWDNGNHILIGDASSGVFAYDINDSSQVVGLKSGSTSVNWFLWQNGVLTILPINGMASAINDSGDIVGWDFYGHAYLYKNGVIADLNTLIDSSAGWNLTKATSINNDGWIVGNGILNGQQRAFLLMPIRYPVLIVPGIAGTYASNVQDDLSWIMARGVTPDQLQIDPLGKVYSDVIRTFENVGYEQGKDLFVVNYDWRLLPGPNDNNINGQIDGLTGVSIADNQFGYGVDYLGWYLKQACEKWREDYNIELDSVDVITHSTGGLVARTYIQSNAYGDIYDPSNNYRLPKIRNLLMVGVPNRGASKAWNPLHDNWVADIVYRFVLSKILNCAYQKVLNGLTVTGPDYNITLSSILDSLGNPSKVKFINKYVPTLRGLLATYDFINFGSGYTNVNNDAAQRNTFVLDLNNGYDLYPNVDPNGFLDEAKVSLLYGTGKSTYDLVEKRDDFETNAVQSFTDWTRTTVLGGTIWYKDLVSGGNNGDGTVPTISSAGQFINDPRAFKYPFTVSDHTGMVSTVEVQSKMLDILDIDYEQANISTGSSASIINVLSVVCDPVESILTDGFGNRLGYSNATGPLAEIPNSIWFGNTDGRGWVFGSVQEPINLQLTGIGEDYYVMVSVEDEEEYGGVVLEGFLGLGEVINYQITLNPLSVDEINNLTPDNYSLAQNYPNPFNPVTTIQYSVPQISYVTLKIYDVLGSEVATLVNEEKAAGNYEINFNASHLSSGMYFYTLKAGSHTETKKLTLLK